MIKFRDENGITLVSIIITVIIILILAYTVNIYIKNGVIDKAQSAVNENDKSYVDEKVGFAVNNCEIDCIGLYGSIENIEYLDYVYTNIKSYLEEFENISIDKNIDYVNIKLCYNDNQYEYKIDSNNKLINNENNKISVGDFVNYPISYYENGTGELFEQGKAWVIIDDGVMKNTSGKVKIMSYGIVGKVRIDEGQDIVNCLNNNFIDMNIYMFDNTWHDVNELVDTKLVERISVLDLDEINNSCNILYENNSKVMKDGDISNGDDIFCNKYGTSFYLASSVDNNTYLVKNNKIDYLSNDFIYKTRCGVKVVITLKEGVLNSLK